MSQVSHGSLAGENPRDLPGHNDNGAGGTDQNLNNRVSVPWLVFWLALVALAAGIIYSVNRRGAFLADDYIVLNQLTFTHTSFLDNLSWFGRDWGVGVQFYRPWVRLAYYFQFLFFGNNPAGWHLFSVFLHLLNSWLVLLLGWRLSRRLGVGGVAALIFALQPVHSEPVSWISGQTDLWATLFSLASVAAWVMFRQVQRQGGNGRRWYIAAIVLFVFGLFSKEVVAALPLALLAYDFITDGVNRIWGHEEEHTGQPAKHVDRATVLRVVKTHAPIWIILVLYIGLRLVLFKGLGGYTPEPDQKIDLILFVKSNLSWLAQPFGLSGTSGLVLIGLALALLGLCGVQEWERYRLQKGLPLDHHHEERQQTRRAPEADEELDDPGAPSPYVADSARPVVQVQAPPPPEEYIPPPPYHTLRTAAYGFAWAALFFLPTLLTPPAERFTYLPSAGFALFMGAILTPFGPERYPGDTRNSRRKRLDHTFELGVWLRVGAIIALLGAYAAATNTRVQQWLDASNTARQVLDMTKQVIPAVDNYSRFVSEGVPDSNNGALIFRTGYRDAIQLLYKNQTLDAEKVDQLPIVSDRLKTTIFLEYKGDRLINHEELRESLLKRNDVAKQEKSFMAWDFTKPVASPVSGNWFEPGGTGQLVNRENVGLVINSNGSGTTLQSPDFSLPSVQLASLEITMKVSARGRSFRGEVTWITSGNNPSNAPQSTSGFDINADGEFHTYHVTPEVASIFAYSDQIARIKLVLPDGIEGVTIQRIEQFQIPVDYKPLAR